MFFDSFFNKNYAQIVKKLKSDNQPLGELNSNEHSEFLAYLNLASIDHRRMLLQLGKKHNIRLHYGACMSMVEIITTLYLYWLNVDPQNPTWYERDRFILSKGHAAPSLYIALFQAGFVPESKFSTYRTISSIFQGHPDRKKTPGVDCSTGSLGQGFPVACGMAWALKNDGNKAKVYCLLSDGECNEGSVWEAALIASNAGLNNLVLIIDHNKKSSYGSMKNRNDIVPLNMKWESFGWNVLTANGHDIADLTRSLKSALDEKNSPTVIICETIKGKGIPLLETQFVSSNNFLEKQYYDESLSNLIELENKLIAKFATRIR